MDWKCMSCESVAPYKGLCRDCTEYGADGEILSPVARVKVNALGLPIVKRKGGSNTNLNKGFRASKKIDVHKTLVEDLSDLASETDEVIDLI
tara:strand:- start:18 stop:293 length:276 start_codon:yes stop_codon:yes gene_type:complete